MKIRILSPLGGHSQGDIVKAIKHPALNEYAAYDPEGRIFHYSTEDLSCEVVEDVDPRQPPVCDTVVGYNSGPQWIKHLSALFGQDIKKITVEF